METITTPSLVIFLVTGLAATWVFLFIMQVMFTWFIYLIRDAIGL